MVDFVPFNWECPYCQHKQTVTEHRFDQQYSHIFIHNHAIYPIGFEIISIACSNHECNKLSVIFSLVKDHQPGVSWTPKEGVEPYLLKRILPESFARPQPDYIPSAIREDYKEACLIRDASPKAAATLARRCLQGMIRDFCNINKKTLYHEINALRQSVDDGTAPPGVTLESVDALDHVRTIGNIGAHMDKDINIIVPVDPGEVQILIGLIESLFEEWYVAREKRKQRFAELKSIAEAKKQKITDGRTEGNSKP